jgi:hypothetical protein
MFTVIALICAIGGYTGYVCGKFKMNHPEVSIMIVSGTWQLRTHRSTRSPTSDTLSQGNLAESLPAQVTFSSRSVSLELLSSPSPLRLRRSQSTRHVTSCGMSL